VTLIILYCSTDQAFASTASAFVAPATGHVSTKVSAVTDMEGITQPIGKEHDVSTAVLTNPKIGFFDPLGFSKGSSDEALAWYREAEIKHGRVAMAAFVGFLVNYQGVSFPFDLDMAGSKFSSLGLGSPFAAWDNLSEKGKWSIIGFIGLLEVNRKHFNGRPT
jgi:hypothetical protein